MLVLRAYERGEAVEIEPVGLDRAIPRGAALTGRYRPSAYLSAEMRGAGGAVSSRWSRNAMARRSVSFEAVGSAWLKCGARRRLERGEGDQRRAVETMGAESAGGRPTGGRARAAVRRGGLADCLGRGCAAGAGEAGSGAGAMRDHEGALQKAVLAALRGCGGAGAAGRASVRLRCSRARADCFEMANMLCTEFRKGTFGHIDYAILSLIPCFLSSRRYFPCFL